MRIMTNYPKAASRAGRELDGAFPSDDKIEEVRTRADIVEVIGAHVRLKRAGRNFVGLWFHFPTLKDAVIFGQRGARVFSLFRLRREAAPCSTS